MARPSRKDRIVEAAAQLFSSKGYHATTVRDIANLAGVVSGSLYAHIAAKEDLLLEIVRVAAFEFAAAITPIVEDTCPSQEKLHQAIFAHIGVISRSPARARVYLYERDSFSPQALAEVQQLRKRYERQWESILREGIADGSFVIADVGLARILILSALNGINRWYHPQGRLTPNEVAEHYAIWITRMFQPD